MSPSPATPRPPRAKPGPRPKTVAAEALAATAHLFPEITHPPKRAFLTAFAACGNRTHAAHAIGATDNRIHYYWLATDPAYATAFAAAERYAGDAAEDKAYDLALNGYFESVWFRGTKVGEQTKYLPTLLIALLNAAKPDKYKYRSLTEHTISPALQALQAQWQAALAHPALPEATIDAEYQPVDPDPPTPAGHPAMPGAPTTQQIFQLLDRVNEETCDDADEVMDDPDDTPQYSTGSKPHLTPAAMNPLRIFKQARQAASEGAHR